MKNSAKVISVESLDEDYEKFQLKLNKIYIDMLVSRKEQPKFFIFLMDCLRDDITFDIGGIDISQ